MFQRGVFFVSLMILEFACSLPLEEKIEPVELFHHCIEPEKEEKEPDKSPVLLLHGLLGTHRNYEDVEQLIAKRTKRRVCSVDLRNHGDSPWNNRSDVAAFAVDIGHFLDKQNIKNVNLIGESLGGKIAIHYALNNPDRVDSLVVEDVRPNNIRKIAILMSRFFFKLLKNIIESQPEGMNEKEVHEWVDKYGKDMLKAMGNPNIPGELSKYVALRFVDGKWQLKHNMELLFEKINKPEEIWTESTGVYTKPVLFIYGTESVFQVGDDKDNILELFPNAKLVPIEGAGHIIHEVRREFDDIVVKFLNEVN